MLVLSNPTHTEVENFVPDPTVSSPLRVAVIGAWHVHAGDYARQTVAHPDTELIAVWDDDPDRGAALAEQYGTEAVSDLAALLARDDLDAVTITTSTVVHREVIGQAIAAGKHVFTEKLLAPTVGEAEEILAAARAAGVQVVVSLPRLYHGYTTAITEVLDGGSARSTDLCTGPAVPRRRHRRLAAGTVLRPRDRDRWGPDRSRLPPGVPGAADPRQHARDGQRHLPVAHRSRGR